MTYSTRENLADAEKDLAFAKALAELYPDARCDHGRWFSGTIKLEECDVVALLPAQQRGQSNVEVYCGKRLESGGVIWSSENWQMFRVLPSFLSGQDQSPREEALRKALLAWAASK